jgi:hypothetical protein
MVYDAAQKRLLLLLLLMREMDGDGITLQHRQTLCALRAKIIICESMS